MTQREPKRRTRRLLAVGIGGLLAIALFELVLQVGAYALWRRGGREVGADGPAAVVLCVGDSFTYGLGASAPDAAYPAQLQRSLDAAAPDRFHVVNGGRAGQSTADVLRRLPAQLAEHRPAHVVVMAGYNDRWKKPDLLAPTDLPPADEAPGFVWRWRTLELARRIVGALRGDGPGEPAGGAEALYGNWAGDDLQVWFGRDGLCVVAGITAPFRIDGDVVEIGNRDVTRVRWERLEDDRLRLCGGPLPESGVTLQRTAATVDAARVGRRVLEAQTDAAPMSADEVERACGVLREHPEDSPLWWRVAAAAGRGVATQQVLETVRRALEVLPEGDPWRAGLLRIRAGLLEATEPDLAFAALLEAALVDGAEETIASWLDAHDSGDARAAYRRALARVSAGPAEVTRLDAMFERAIVPPERVGAVLATHLESIVDLARAAGSSAWIATYPMREPLVDPAIRAGAARSDARLVDVTAAFDATTRPHDELFVMDGHCSDAGYALVARTVAAALLAGR